METKFKLNFLLKNSINTLFKSSRPNIKNLFSKAKKFTFNKTNFLIFLNSAIFFTYIKKSNNILFAASDERKKIPLEEKVNVIEYNANTPIEDRYNVIKLKNIEGNLLAVFDGHGGDLTSEYASSKIAPYLDSIYLELTKNTKNKDKTKDQLISQALYDTFQKIEEELLKRAKDLYYNGEGKKACCGSCALVIVATEEKLYIAQLGDSKAKLYKKIDNRIISKKLTTTFNCEKPHQQLELFKKFKDIDIVYCKRELNKSFGDFHLKSIYFNRTKTDNFKKPIIPFNGPYISAVPDITIYPIQNNDYSMILATDGFWDEFTSDEVAKFIEKNIRKDNTSFINLLMKHSLSKAAEASNMSLVDLINLPEEKKRRVYDDTTIIYYKF